MAIGFRVDRREANTPTSTHITADPAMARGYSDVSPNGAPTTRSPGAAHTPAIRPTAPLQGPSNTFSAKIAIRPSVAGTINAAIGPRRRMRLRYQNGPSMSGADVTADGPLVDRVERGGSEGAYESTTVTAYGVGAAVRGHPRGPEAAVRDALPDEVPDVALPDIVMVGVAATTVLAVWSSAVGPAVLLGLVAAAIIGRWSRSWWPAMLVVGLTIVGGVRAEHAWNGLTPDRLGPYDGWVRLVDDPHSYGTSTRLVVAIDGERFEVWCRGRAQQRRVGTWRAGELVAVSGTRRVLADDRARRVASQHVVGVFDVEWAADVDTGNPLARASNRVRGVIERGASWMPAPEGALFRGLVIGDDRDQPADMVERFRASGLSHLTAVSGQNVGFLLAAFGPLLVRLRPVPRWVITVGVVAWFVALTRFEPSIVRAGAMAALSATAYATGRERAPVRLLAVAVSGLVLVDPLLVWSVGFWLSVGATAGVCAIGPPLAKRLPRLGGLAVPLGITLGAQVGVVVPSVLVFGRLPLVSIPANLLAVPVAGAVMLYGLPAALLAGAVPPLAPVVMLPALVGTRWVDAVAQVAALVEPEPPWVWIGWVVVVLLGVVLVVSASRSGKNRRRHDDTPADR